MFKTISFFQRSRCQWVWSLSLLFLREGSGVLWSISLSVCLRTYLRNHTSKLYQIFCICYVRTWLVPSLMELQYTICTSGLVDDAIFPIMGPMVRATQVWCTFKVTRQGAARIWLTMTQSRTGGRSLLSTIALLPCALRMCTNKRIRMCRFCSSVAY